MSIPSRVQRKRTKGFKLPENTVCVNRGTMYGNPFKVISFKSGGCKIELNIKYDCFVIPEFNRHAIYAFKDGAIKQSIAYYEKYLQLNPSLTKAIRYNLKGKNLACFCALDQPCHADSLLSIANK